MKTAVYLVLFITLLSSTSCLKQEPERPADLSGYDPMLPVTHTIAELKALNGFYNYQTGGDTTLVEGDVIISGIVTADDRSGNFYKQLVIEDSTAAIMLLIDANNLYNDYPIGRKLYVKCRGLYLGYDGGLPVLGADPGLQLVPSGIPNDQVGEHIIKASVGHQLQPTVVDMTQVKTAYENLYNRLITITDVQFSDTSRTYAQLNGTTNRDLQDCYGNKLTLRTSNFSSFSSQALPKGNGSVTGIYTVYISPTTASKTPQLLIRDTGDVKFLNARCTITAPLINLISIDSLRNLYTGVQLNLSNYRVTGVVISDRTNKNIDVKNLVLQNGQSGITVRFSATHSFDLGDSLVIDISSAQLGEYNGLLEVGSVGSGTTFQTSKAAKVSEGRIIAPRQVTIGQVFTDPEGFESTLVKIADATASGGSTYVTGTSGSKSLSDITGSITLYTSSGATFANAALPAVPMRWTGIIGQYGTTMQLQLRNLDDVQP